MKLKKIFIFKQIYRCRFGCRSNQSMQYPLNIQMARQTLYPWEKVIDRSSTVLQVPIKHLMLKYPHLQPNRAINCIVSYGKPNIGHLYKMIMNKTTVFIASSVSFYKHTQHRLIINKQLTKKETNKFIIRSVF